MSMLDRAKAIADEIVRLRRDIHAHPELGFQEHRTSALVADTLSEIGGITVTTGIAKTGVVGQIGTGDGPTIAIRADMDALPILSETNSAYNSTNPGVHHACGHDAHTAMLLGAAHLLREEFAKGTVKGNVKFLFQPSEEGWDDEAKSGGLRMVEEGVMTGVDAVIAIHVDSTAPVGKVTVRDGFVTAAVDDFQGYIYGTGGHGAMPHTGTDPVHMLIPVLTALFGIRSRLLDPMEPGILSVGVVRGGGASNVIPSEIFIQGTLRSFSEAVREKLATEVEKAFKVAEAFGGRGEVKITRGYPAGYNDARVADWMGQVAVEYMGSDAIDNSRRGMGAEDFSYMAQKAPGAMLMLGAAIPDGIVRAHHTPLFDIDERALPYGSALLAETALRFLRGENKL
jgi:amidohydrolase